MHYRIRVIDIPVFIGIRATHENKILLILDCPFENRSAVFQTLAKESVCIVAGRADPDYKLIGICLHRLLKEVVLFRAFEGMYFITYCYVAVQ